MHTFLLQSVHYFFFFIIVVVGILYKDLNRSNEEDYFMNIFKYRHRLFSYHSKTKMLRIAYLLARKKTEY